MNKLGESGIRTKETLKRMREEKKARTHEVDELKAQLAAAEAERDALKEGSAKKPAAKKRARAKEESDDEDAFEGAKPAPKKRATKVKKEEVDVDESVPEVKPKAKKGRKSAVKEEVADEDIGVTDIPGAKSKAATKGRKKAVKKEETDAGDELAAEVKPKAPAKRGRKAAVKEEVIDEGDDIAKAPEAKPKAAAKKGRKKAVKKEESEVQVALEEEVKGEAVESSSSLSAIPSLIQDEDATGSPVKNEEEPMEAINDAAQGSNAAEEDAKINHSQSKKAGGRVKSL
jgi:hypothetical protein